MKRGALILLEGLDRSGKSTQCRLLVDALNQRNIRTIGMHFPDRDTTIGKVICNYLQDTTEIDNEAIHLLFSANRWEKRQEILATLRSGTTIVMDRYSYSGIAFSMAKGLSKQWCSGPENGLPYPDAIYFLDIDPKLIKQRGGYGAEKYETDAMQSRVREMFEEIRDHTWMIFNANQTIESLHGELLEQSLEAMAQVSETKIKLIGESNPTH